MPALITWHRDNYPAPLWKADWLKSSHWLHDDGRIVTRRGYTIARTVAEYLGAR